MTNSNIASLIFVVKSSQSQLQTLTEQLPNTPRSGVDIILRNIQKESANLSSALSRLSTFIEDIEPATPVIQPVDHDDSLLETAMLMLESGDRLHCKFCNGVLPRWDTESQEYVA